MTPSDAQWTSSSTPSTARLAICAKYAYDPNAPAGAQIQLLSCVPEETEAG
jgi:hypothetical protein